MGCRPSGRGGTPSVYRDATPLSEVRPLPMITFFIRRFLTSALVVLISTFIMYVLVAASIDPLADLRTSRSPNKAQLIANRIAQLNLDQPVVERYLNWLKGALGCVVGNCNLG